LHAAPSVVVPSLVAGEGPPEVVGVHELERAFERAAKVIGPSVVSIISERTADTSDIPPFLRPFGPPDGTIRGLGSGVILDAKGYVLTNNHVVDGADVLRVRLHDEREVSAEVIGTDEKTDLAVIRIDADGLVPARTGASEHVRVGQWVMAAGSPFGLSKSVSAGIVSAVGRGGMGITDYGDFIQTDAAVNQGNSGGPLIDLEGRVIGINTAIASQSGGSNGVGFAIPSDLARTVMSQLVEHGSVERGWLGIVMGRLTPELAASFGHVGTDGVLVDDVDGKGPAARAGVRPGDVITAIDGKPMRDMVALRNFIAQRRPGTKVKLTVEREGKARGLELQLGALPGQSDGKVRKRSETKPRAKAIAFPGMRLVDLDDAMRDRLQADDVRGGAVVAETTPGSAAARELQPGDILVEVGTTAVANAGAARKLLDKADATRGVRLRIERGGVGRYVLLRRDP
jgi:serine protease Do